jgi:hypothetical protein
MDTLDFARRQLEQTRRIAHKLRLLRLRLRQLQHTNEQLLVASRDLLDQAPEALIRAGPPPLRPRKDPPI